jgi:hypothetical protein
VLIHLIGGLANRMTGGAVAAFAQAANACRVVGVSLYAYPETTAAEWAALDKPGGPPAATNSC